MLSRGSENYLIDCGPDFRCQMIDNDLSKIDAVYFTHEHTDHIIGLDDLRPIIFSAGREMPLFAEKRVLNQIKNRFSYAFSENKYPGAPSFLLSEISPGESVMGGLCTVLRVLHGELPIVGFKTQKSAYITDASDFPEETFEELYELDTLVLNCIRRSHPHHSHFVLEDIEKLHDILRPGRLYLTHLSHEFGTSAAANSFLPEGIHLAYDGLEIPFD